MSNEKLEGKNITNNVLTSKGTRVFKRRNKVKVALATSSLVIGTATGVGISYPIFHKDSNEIPPIAAVYTYDITPTTYQDASNSVSWTANEYKDGELIETKTGTTSLEHDIKSFLVTFSDGNQNTFEVDWKFTPIPKPTSFTLAYLKNQYWSNDQYWFEISDYVATTSVPTLIDNYGNSGTATFSYVGILPEGLDLDINTGEIYGKPKKVEQQEITIKAIGVGLWSGLESTFTISFDITIENSFILTNNERVKVINPDGLMTLYSFDDNRLDNNTYTSIPISDVSLVKEVRLTPDQTITEVDQYANLVCRNMINLEYASINLPQSITKVNEEFCHGLFTNCKKLTRLSPDFNLPQSIQGSVLYDFCSYMFNGCESLKSLPDNFTMPQGITSVYHFFCEAMFQNCSSLEKLPSNFKIPNGIKTATHYFFAWMFAGCTKLTTIPVGINIPTGITEAKEFFCYSMFENCLSLQGYGDSEPRNFKSQIQTCDAGSFCGWMFYGCTILNNVNVPEAPTLEQLNLGYNIARS